jgi:EAL domain-containing protein (putative c-di-GMP-specific phosphodiesterase class I)
MPNPSGCLPGIDDFGTGFASLSSLTKLPITCIKIDRSFTSRINEDPSCKALVCATVAIGADLRIECIVEGVETTEQLAGLPAYEGLLVQVCFYGRPATAQEVVALIDGGSLRWPDR